MLKPTGGELHEPAIHRRWFDDTTYSPRGGMYSEGDIEWVIAR